MFIHSNIYERLNKLVPWTVLAVFTDQVVACGINSKNSQFNCYIKTIAALNFYQQFECWRIFFSVIVSKLMVSIKHLFLNHCSNLHDNFVNWRCLLLLIRLAQVYLRKERIIKIILNCSKIVDSCGMW